MSNIAQQRIQREFREVVKSEEVAKSGVQLTLVNDDLTELKGTIAGPPDTPYEGGTYILEIKIPDTYPFNPPKVRFVTKIWHPNISSVTGAICLDILKDQWAAAMTLRTVLLSLQVRPLHALIYRVLRTGIPIRQTRLSAQVQLGKGTYKKRKGIEPLKYFGSIKMPRVHQNEP